MSGHLAGPWFGQGFLFVSHSVSLSVKWASLPAHAPAGCDTVMPLTSEGFAGPVPLLDLGHSLHP